MAIRENLIQARSLYVGVSPNVAPASSNLGVDGSIGIGTPTPNERLHIVGNTGTRIRISSSDNYHIGNLGWEDTRVFLSAAGYGSPALGFDTAGSERMRITNGGNVGIGTTNPDFNLTINGITGIQSSGTTKYHFAYYNGGLNFAETGIADYRLFIKDGGDVGIGTGSPIYKLDVNGWVGASRYYPYNTNSSYIDGDGSGIRLSGPGYFYSAVSGGSYFEGPMKVRNSISNDSNSYLQINGGTANITYFAGTVGVGFTTMYHNASLSLANKLFIGQTNNSDIGGTIYGYWDSGYQAYAGGLKFQVFNANGGFPYTMKDSMTLSGSGNVGIGTTDPIASLDNQGGLGTYRQRGFTTMVTNELAADGTNANRYEIARATIDYNDWNDSGTIEIELYEKYWSDGLKKRYVVTYGYSAGANKYLVEMSGIGVNNFMVSIGAPVVISGDLRYLPIYVDVRYYTRVIAVVKTNRYLTTANPPGAGGIWFNNAPSITYIADTGMDSTVYVGPVMGATSVFAGGNVGIGTSSPVSKAQVTFQSDFDGLRIENSSRGHNYLLTTAGTSAEFFSIYDVDNSQYLYQLGNTGHGFLTGGVTRMVINSSGDVGIGITNPQAKLEVADNIYINGGNGQGLRMNGGMSIFRQNGSDLAFNTSNSETMRITSAGNIGIGTSAPAAKLEVYGTGFTSGSVNFLARNGVGTKIIESFDDGLIRLNNLLNIGQAIYINSGNCNRHYVQDAHIFSVVDDVFQRVEFVTIKGNLGKPAMGVGTMSPDNSAILDLTSRSKGFLPPRMTNTEMNAISSPAAGLVVYDTTNNKLTVYNGSTWAPLH